MASDFIRKISASIIRSDTQKISFLGNIPKNDKIRYTTLITLVMSSKIKPGMFISLLCIHMVIHCMGIRPITLVTAVSVVSRVASQ